jgi:transposase, IS30 family
MGRRRWLKLDRGVRSEVIRLAAQGLTYRQIIERLDVPMGSVGRVLAPLGGVYRPEMWSPGDLRLSIDERIEIRVGLELGLTFTAIAEQLNRAVSTVSREVHANGGRKNYRPFAAQRRAARLARRPKSTKLSCPRLCQRVTED